MTCKTTTAEPYDPTLKNRYPIKYASGDFMPNLSSNYPERPQALNATGKTAMKSIRLRSAAFSLMPFAALAAGLAGPGHARNQSVFTAAYSTLESNRRRDTIKAAIHTPQ